MRNGRSGEPPGGDLAQDRRLSKLTKRRSWRTARGARSPRAIDGESAARALLRGRSRAISRLGRSRRGPFAARSRLGSPPWKPFVDRSRAGSVRSGRSRANDERGMIGGGASRRTGVGEVFGRALGGSGGAEGACWARSAANRRWGEVVVGDQRLESA